MPKADSYIYSKSGFPREETLFPNSNYQKVDTQDELPFIREVIDKVGIEGIRTCVILQDNGITYTYFPTINIVIDLGSQKKGIHMSRLVESVNEVAPGTPGETRKNFEDVGAKIISVLRERHSFKRAEVTLATTIFVKRSTPTSNNPTNEPYDVSVKVICDNGKFLKRLEAKVIGSTLCPHSLNMTNGKSHVQRAEIQLAINTDFKTDLPLERLIDICEESFSAPTYTVLKSHDEAALVDKMYSNPKFVEDVVRECFDRLTKEKIDGKAWIKATAYESIHKHNAISELERNIGKGG